MKFKRIVMLVMIILMFMPSIAFAEVVTSSEPHDFKNGLLDDKDLIVSNNMIEEVYDNDKSTFGGAWSKDALIEFKYATDITGYFLEPYNYTGDPPYYMTIHYFNGNDVEVKEHKMKNGYNALDVKGVLKIEIHLNSTSSGQKLNELDFFGSYDTSPDFNDGLLDDKDFMNIVESNSFPKEAYDNNDSTAAPVTTSNYELVFTEPVNLQKIYLNYSMDKSYTKFRVFLKNGGIENISLDLDNPNEFKGYVDVNLTDVTKIAMNANNYWEGNKLYEMDIYGSYNATPEDTTPPEDIKNLKHTVSSDSVSFTYDLPVDDDFSHIQILRDMEVIVDNHKLATFTDDKLEPETGYHYTFKSVDTNGNVSVGSSITVATNPENDTVAPSAPEGLKVKQGNSSLAVTWHENPENDVAGYNVYVNGEKYNLSLIKGTVFNLTNLNNGMEYNISVSAVDSSENESDKSAIVSAIPDKDSMPIFDLNTDLSDVATSTENWFSELWLVLAFGVAIPLAFLIANRIKSLFLA